MGKSISQWTPRDLGAISVWFLLMLQLGPTEATDDNYQEKGNNFCSGEVLPQSTHGASQCFSFCTRSTKCKPDVIERFWLEKEEKLANETSTERFVDESTVKATIQDVFVNISQDLFFSLHPSQRPVMLYGNELEVSDRVQLPRSLFKSMKPRKNSVRVILMVIDIGEGEIFKGSATGQEFKYSVLDNRMVGIRVGKEPIKDLEEPVEITFSHKHQHQNMTLKCVFWDANKGTTGDWNSSGCSTEQRVNHTICRCDHLTFFALLLNPSLDAFSVTVLTRIAVVGCSTSLFFLFLTIILYFSLRFTRQRFKSEDGPKIHVALSISLFFLNLTFIISPKHNVSNTASCSALGGIFHYFLLCCFTWMGIEAFHMYLLAIKIFNIFISRYFLKLSLVGWGLPILVVFITACTGCYGPFTIKDGANHTTFSLCWIENKIALHLTVHSYFAVIFLFNGVILVLVAWKIFCLHGSKTGKEPIQNWKKILTTLGLSCLVGVTWALVFGPISIATMYIFTLLNSLQGVFIFIWFAILYYPNLKGGSSSSTAKTDHINSASRE